MTDRNTGSTEPGRGRNFGADTDVLSPAYSQTLCEKGPDSTT